MGYVQDLRAIVGHRPLILVSAGVIILSDQGHILMQRRKDDLLWSIPGGSMELGESTEETARREVKEETGLTVGEMNFFGIFSGREMYHQYPNGDHAAIVSVVYVTSDVKGELLIETNEGNEFGYFSTEALSTLNLSSPNKPIVKRFLQALEK